MSDLNTSSMSETIRETRICGCQSSTFFKIINMVLGVFMVVYSVFDFIAIFGDLKCQSPIICVTFRVYLILFGALLVISFCDFKFIKENFLFLKSTTGKGLFNIFLASMFLVGSNGDIWAWVMMACFLICGLFFTIIGCCVKEAYADDDINSKEVVTRLSAKGAKTAYEN